jgi:hypothetical protein
LPLPFAQSTSPIHQAVRFKSNATMQTSPGKEATTAKLWSRARAGAYSCGFLRLLCCVFSFGAGFWRRSDTYLEQPHVLFTKSLIAVGTAADGSRVIQYSSIERFNYLVGYDNVKQPALRVSDALGAKQPHDK